MDKEQKRKVVEIVTDEMRYMHDHSEINFPKWYIDLVQSAEQRIIMRDYSGALHDIKQAITGRYESMGVCL